MKNVTFANETIENRTNQFKALLNDGGRFNSAVIMARTSASLQPKKNGCPYGAKDAITKLTKYSVGVNGNYKRMIDNRLKAEGANDANYIPKKAWHVTIFDGINGCIVAKRSEVEAGLPLTETYVKFVSNAATTSDYLFGTRKATSDETATVRRWAKDRAAEAAKTQGLKKKENAAIICTVKLSGITEVHANKEVFIK
jgi:hypothetical protein